MIPSLNHFFYKANHYRFNNSWSIAAPLEETWDELIKYRKWSTWCSALEKIEPFNQFDQIKTGNQFRSVWKGTLPYYIRFDVVIKEVIPYSVISFNVTGDLCGKGVCHFFQTNENTCINFIWNVSPTKLWMKISSPFAKSIFIKKHDQMIEQIFMDFVQMLSS